MSTQKIRLANIYIEQARICGETLDLPGAVENFTKAIDIFKGMAEEEPGVWALVADTIEKAAATYKGAGKLADAAECLKEAATIRESLIKREQQEE